MSNPCRGVRRFVRWSSLAMLGSALALQAEAARAEGTSTAGSTVHWDASAQVGLAKRFLSDRPPGGGDAGFGPTGQLSAHVALLPLVRVGAYGAWDLSPTAGAGATRDLFAFGLRAKVFTPWPRGTVRTWLFLGFGYVAMSSRSHAAEVPLASGAGASARTERVTVAAAGGHFFELPIGIGASYKFRKPWHVVAELGLRYGFGHGGSAYDPSGPSFFAASSGARGHVLPAGHDSFGLGLTIGVLLDQ